LLEEGLGKDSALLPLFYCLFERIVQESVLNVFIGYFLNMLKFEWYYIKFLRHLGQRDSLQVQAQDFWVALLR
jgi:hypothetical protein